MKLTRLAPLVLAAPLALTACSGSSSPTTTAAATQAPSSTASISVSDTSTAPSGATETSTPDAGGGAAPADAQPGQPVDKNALIDAISAASKEAKTQHMEMVSHITGGSTKVDATSSGDVDNSDPANPKMIMTTTVKGETQKIIAIDRKIYMQTAKLGSKWMMLPMTAAAKAAGQDPTEMFDPTAAIKRQKEAVTSATYVGEEDVDGAKTKHYKLVLDMSKASSSKLASSAKPAPYDLWLDEKNLVRKFTIDSVIASMTTRVEGTMSKFGEPVTVTAPPSSQVTTMPGMPTK